MKKTLLAIATFSVLLGACKKDEGGGSGAKSKTDMLSSGKWLLTAHIYQATVDGVAETPIDRYAETDACERDDLMLLKTDKMIVIDEGATKCDPGDPQQYTVGNWSLLENDTKFRQSNPVITINWNVEQLDENVFSISNTQNDVFGGSTYVYKTIQTFKKVP